MRIAAVLSLCLGLVVAQNVLPNTIVSNSGVLISGKKQLISETVISSRFESIEWGGPKKPDNSGYQYAFLTE